MTQETQESTTRLYHFLQENIEAIRACEPELYSWLVSQEYDQDRLENNIFTNENGFLDYRTPRGGGIFEPIPPIAFYKNWSFSERPESSATIIIGCNLGYGVNHVLTETPPTHKVLVLEPDPEILLACLGQSDYSGFIRERRLIFIPPNEDVMLNRIHQLDVQFLFGRINLKEDLPSRQISAKYAQWSVRARARLDSFSVELATLRSRQDVMIGNELKNFQRALGDGSLKNMKNCAKGAAAVVFGAGPSLPEFVHDFKQEENAAQNNKRAIYATSLQALPALHRQGVRPDFCIAIDYSEGMLAIFKTLDTEWAKDIPLVYSTKVHPEILDRYPGPTIPLWTMGGISSFVMGNRELVLDAGGNVGVTILRFLRYCGVDDFLLVGQDFARLEDKTHAAGHHAAKTNAAHLKKVYNVPTKDKDGNRIMTSIQLLSAKRDIEDDLANASSRVYNLYGGGVDIIGTTPITREEAINLDFLNRDNNLTADFSDSLHRARTPKIWPAFEPRASQWASSLRSVEKRLEKLFKKPEKNQQAIHQTLSQVDFFLRQDPLYTPYLYNEIMDASALVKGKLRYVRKDLSQIKGLFRRALNKVREMDRCLGHTEAA